MLSSEVVHEYLECAKFVVPLQILGFFSLKLSLKVAMVVDK